MNEVTKAAQAAYNAGLTVIPPKEDGSHAPISAWKQYQSERPTRHQMNTWYRNDRNGIGLITGSDELECLEFEEESIYQTFCDTAEAAGLGDLVERITSGYCERSGGGGYHWLYRCIAVSGNTKLASGENDETLIETRGTGGFIVVAPSNGKVHKDGGTYELLSGSFDTICRISAEERESLFELARAFDKKTKQEYQPNTAPPPTSVGNRPGDAFNEEGPSWDSILNGWALVHSNGQTEYWRRPGKDRGISATINGAGVEPDRLYVFTTSTAFEANRSYTKFQVHTLIEHAGDFRAAARYLAAQGYGESYEDTRLIINNNKRAEPVTGTKRETYPLTDTGNAERLVDRYGDRIRFVTLWDKWIVYDGKRWQKDEARHLEQMAKKTARAITASAENITEKKLKGTVSGWGKRSESTSSKRNMIVSAQAEPGIVLHHEELDKDPYVLNTSNGTVNLTDGTTGPFRKLDYLSHITATPCEPMDTPLFDAFMKRIFNHNDELIRFVQRAIGYSFTGSTDEQVLFILHGNGANGKTTFLELMLDLAGDYGATTPATTVFERRPDTIPNDLARLQGLRFVSVHETDDRRALSEAMVKQMTGGDRISARFMRGEWFDFDPLFKIWLATNHKPEIRGTDHAIWRRIRLIPFDVTIPEWERDPDLKQKLHTESPGILQWIVDGASMWHREGLGMPDAVREATETYQDESDSIGMWIDERCSVDVDVEEKSSVLYADYVRWMHDMGLIPVSQTRFGTEVGSRGGLQKTKSHGVMIVRGLQLKPATSFKIHQNGEMH